MPIMIFREFGKNPGNFQLFGNNFKNGNRDGTSGIWNSRTSEVPDVDTYNEALLRLDLIVYFTIYIHYRYFVYV